MGLGRFFGRGLGGVLGHRGRSSACGCAGRCVGLDLLVDLLVEFFFALIDILDLLRLRNSLTRDEAVYRSVLDEGVRQLLATLDVIRVRGPLRPIA